VVLAATLVSRFASEPVAAQGPLTADEVRRIIGQAAAEAQAANLRATIAVTDNEGNVLGVFRMTGAPATSRVDPGVTKDRPVRGTPHGLEGLDLPSDLVAITKAGTGALLSSGGNAFSTRTASFIVGAHFPPGIDSTPGGPLFGVQFSSVLCTDFRNPPLPLGLAGDPGGMPLYKDGRAVGGVGVEGDGVYTVDTDPKDFDEPAEERAAVAGARGFDPPDLIRADRILADGIRIPFVNARAQGASGDVSGSFLMAPRGGQPSAFVATSLVPGVPGVTDPSHPIRAGAVLTAGDVTTILTQAAQQTAVTRGAIRQPLGSNARVSIAVIDLDGSILGFFQNQDAPNFGLDVSVQKGRTANFFSSPGAGAALRNGGQAIYLRDGVPLDGTFVYSSRAVGFLAQPFFPPGIEGTDPGAFSVPVSEWSPFNTGLQLDLLITPDVTALLTPGGCVPRVPGLPNGITIFPGGVPLFKGGRLAGAIGISGDGVDQDDLIAAAGAGGFDAPADKRSDNLVIRGVRLPWQKFPRHPNL
jgi:uncharacterized protein GlcG (DUF336 family)